MVAAVKSASTSAARALEGAPSEPSRAIVATVVVLNTIASLATKFNIEHVAMATRLAATGSIAERSAQDRHHSQVAAERHRAVQQVKPHEPVRDRGSR